MRRALCLGIGVLAAGCCDERGGRGGRGVRPDDTTSSSELPPVAGDTGEALAWVMVDAGHNLSCGLLDDERAVCWGIDDWVDLTPTLPFTQVSVEYSAACGLEPDGSVTCWCGIPSDYSGPCFDVPTRGGFEKVGVGGWACAEDPEHLLHCWGGLGDQRATPDKEVLHWAVGPNAACAVLADQTVTCWGNTASWDSGGAQAALAPPEGLAYVQVAVGVNHACALDSDGEAHCWGSTMFRLPFPHDGPPGPWSSIHAAGEYACALAADGTAACWGNYPGKPDDWDLPPYDDWIQLGVGDSSACGLRETGDALCFDATWTEEYGDVEDPPDLRDL